MRQFFLSDLALHIFFLFKNVFKNFSQTLAMTFLPAYFILLKILSFQMRTWFKLHLFSNTCRREIIANIFVRVSKYFPADISSFPMELEV